jgi:hypothetical protein
MINVPRAHRIYDFLDGQGIATAGLRIEFTDRDEAASGEASTKAKPADGRTATSSANPPFEMPQPPICPYRPERYGLDLEDLRAARIVDVRLAAHRNALGQAVYSPQDMRRWDRRAAKAVARDTTAFGSIHALNWPPDVADRDALAGKLSQLRALAPDAIIGVTIEACWVERNLQWIIDSGVELVTILAADWPTSQPQGLAHLIVRVADQLSETARQAGHEPARLMIVPPDAITVLDVIKLLALGADLVAVDGWCRNLFEVRREGLSASDWAAINLGVLSTDLVNEENNIDFTDLENRLSMLRQTYEEMGISEVGELNRDHLVCYSEAIPGIRSMGLPREGGVA